MPATSDRSARPATTHGTHFERVDICYAVEVARVFEEHRPDAVMHLAGRVARRPLDRRPRRLHPDQRRRDLHPPPRRPSLLDQPGPGGSRGVPVPPHLDRRGLWVARGRGFLRRGDSLRPRSPYSASKASSDHLVRAWHHTYGLPTLVTNCSNNYGPYHFPEKLVPLVILNAKAGKPLPIYGKGDNVRDWLYVDDHARALRLVLEKGIPGETYNIGGHNERTNLEVVREICRLLDESRPDSHYFPHESLITYVADRPGHDKRYAIDASKIERELDWRPSETFESGLRKTVGWYLENEEWCRDVQSGGYRQERLGLGVSS